MDHAQLTPNKNGNIMDRVELRYTATSSPAAPSFLRYSCSLSSLIHPPPPPPPLSSRLLWAPRACEGEFRHPRRRDSSALFQSADFFFLPSLVLCFTTVVVVGVVGEWRVGELGGEVVVVVGILGRERSSEPCQASGREAARRLKYLRMFHVNCAAFIRLSPAAK